MKIERLKLLISIVFTIGVDDDDHSKSHDPLHFDIILLIETVTFIN